MSKTKRRNERALVGIDVSKDTLDVSKQRGDEGVERGQFGNEHTEWRKLLRWASKGVSTVRVVLEATGVYHLDLALFLHAQENVEVMVVNPRAARHFAEAAMRRAKTDAISADVLVAFARGMAFTPWKPPRSEVLAVRTVARRIDALKAQLVAEKNRLHAADFVGATPAVVCADINGNIAQLDSRIAELTAQAVTLIEQDALMRQRYEQLLSATGIATASAVQLIGELLVLPPDMTARQWVAHAGLDPRPFQSGTSVHRPARISRRGNARLRAILYFPALSATQHDPHVQVFTKNLAARGLKGLQIVAAVMRKLLHAIYGMWRTDTSWAGEKLFAGSRVQAGAGANRTL